MHYLSVRITAHRAGGDRLGEASQLKTTGEGGGGGGGVLSVLRGYSLGKGYTSHIDVVERFFKTYLRNYMFVVHTDRK